MRVGLICGSSLLYLPYIESYKRILKSINVDYQIINWDRFHIENDLEYKYRDKKVGHKRNYIDYLKFKTFIINILENEKFDKLVVFNLQLAHFLGNFLCKYYKGNYILDLRDYHKIIKFTNVKNLVENSFLIVISSPGFKDWLPKSEKYIINHNTQFSSKSLIKETKVEVKNRLNGTVIISYIGTLRDYDINEKFIRSLSNKKNIKLVFHGDGIINRQIEDYINKNNIANVNVFGRYYKEEEAELYKKSDLINIFLDQDINGKTLLPNRLYNAVIYNKPIITLSGTYLAELVIKYNLGLALPSFENVENHIFSYLEEFDETEYQQGRIKFLKQVMCDNHLFDLKIKEFIKY